MSGSGKLNLSYWNYYPDLVVYNDPISKTITNIVEEADTNVGGITRSDPYIFSRDFSGSIDFTSGESSNSLYWMQSEKMDLYYSISPYVSISVSSSYTGMGIAISDSISDLESFIDEVNNMDPMDYTDSFLTDSYSFSNFNGYYSNSGSFSGEPSLGYSSGRFYVLFYDLNNFNQSYSGFGDYFDVSFSLSGEFAHERSVAASESDCVYTLFSSQNYTPDYTQQSCSFGGVLCTKNITYDYDPHFKIDASIDDFSNTTFSASEIEVKLVYLDDVGQFDYATTIGTYSGGQINQYYDVGTDSYIISLSSVINISKDPYQIVANMNHMMEALYILKVTTNVGVFTKHQVVNRYPVLYKHVFPTGSPYLNTLNQKMYVPLENEDLNKIYNPGTKIYYGGGFAKFNPSTYIPSATNIPISYRTTKSKETKIAYLYIDGYNNILSCSNGISTGDISGAVFSVTLDTSTNTFIPISYYNLGKNRIVCDYVTGGAGPILDKEQFGGDIYYVKKNYSSSSVDYDITKDESDNSWSISTGCPMTFTDISGGDNFYWREEYPSYFITKEITGASTETYTQAEKEGSISGLSDYSLISTDPNGVSLYSANIDLKIANLDPSNMLTLSVERHEIYKNLVDNEPVYMLKTKFNHPYGQVRGNDWNNPDTGSIKIHYTDISSTVGRMMVRNNFIPSYSTPDYNAYLWHPLHSNNTTFTASGVVTFSYGNTQYNQQIFTKQHVSIPLRDPLNAVAQFYSTNDLRFKGMRGGIVPQTLDLDESLQPFLSIDTSGYAEMDYAQPYYGRTAPTSLMLFEINPTKFLATPVGYFKLEAFDNTTVVSSTNPPNPEDILAVSFDPTTDTKFKLTVKDTDYPYGSNELMYYHIATLSNTQTYTATKRHTEFKLDLTYGTNAFKRAVLGIDFTYNSGTKEYTSNINDLYIFEVVTTYPPEITI